MARRVSDRRQAVPRTGRLVLGGDVMFDGVIKTWLPWAGVARQSLREL